MMSGIAIIGTLVFDANRFVYALPHDNSDWMKIVLEDGIVIKSKCGANNVYDALNNAKGGNGSDEITKLTEAYNQVIRAYEKATNLILKYEPYKDDKAEYAAYLDQLEQEETR